MKKYNYKQNKKIKKSQKIVLFSILVILIFLSIFMLNNLKNNTSFLTSLFNKPVSYIKNKLDILKNNEYLISENEKLIQENLELIYIKEENKELEANIEILKEQLELKNVYSDYDLINATVISRNKTYFFNELTIDKGSNNNIEKDMAVVTKQGLIGKIIRVYKDSAIVKMITNGDTNNKISVSVNNLNGIITGYDNINNYIEITGLTSYDEVEVGNVVTTTGLGVFPKGITVGEVEKIKKDNYNISKILYVKPCQDMNNINYVVVLGNKIYD